MPCEKKTWSPVSSTSPSPTRCPPGWCRGQTRISVDPKYVLLVDRDQVRLEGKLGYTIRGARVTAVEVAIPGWELDEVGPDSLVAVDGVTVNSRRGLHPSAAAFLRADGIAVAGASSHRSRGDLACGSVAAAAGERRRARRRWPWSPADNVELTPNNQAIEGLVRQRSAPPMRLLPNGSRNRCTIAAPAARPSFAADFRIHAQQITVDVATQVTLAEQAAAVEQKLSYSVAYEPVDRLTLPLPRTLAAAKRIRILHDGKPLVPARVPRDDSAGADAATPVSMRLSLPDPHIGIIRSACNTRFRSPSRSPTSRRRLPSRCRCPRTESSLPTVLLVKAARNIRVSPQGRRWTIADRDVRRSPAAAATAT